MLGGASQISKGVASGIPEDGSRKLSETGRSGLPTGWGHCVSLERGLHFSRKVAAVLWCYIPAWAIQQPLLHASPPSLLL